MESLLFCGKGRAGLASLFGFFCLGCFLFFAEKRTKTSSKAKTSAAVYMFQFPAKTLPVLVICSKYLNHTSVDMHICHE